MEVRYLYSSNLDKYKLKFCLLQKALLLGMCIPNFYKPLIFSKKSHNFGDAKNRYVKREVFRRGDLHLTNTLSRYLETAALVYSWYLDDCWDEESVASKMIRRVNSMHR